MESKRKRVSRDTGDGTVASISPKRQKTAPKRATKKDPAPKKLTARKTPQPKKVKEPESTTQPIDTDLTSDNEEITEDAAFPIWDTAEILRELSGVPQHVANNFVQLIEDDNTLPFIARYRKSMVDHMTPEKLQELFELLGSVRQLKKKSLTILNALQKHNKLTPDLQNSIVNARSLAELELLYEPLKVRRATLGDKARQLGLEGATQIALNGGYVSLNQYRNDSVDGLKTNEEIENHIVHLMAEFIYKDSRVLEKIRKLRADAKIYIESSKAKCTAKKQQEKGSKSSHHKDKENNDEKYSFYENFKLRVDYMKSHQILALNRGEAVKALTVKVLIPDWFFNNLERFENQYSHIQ